jgi:hypothetical protein
MRISAVALVILIAGIAAFSQQQQSAATSLGTSSSSPQPAIQSNGTATQSSSASTKDEQPSLKSPALDLTPDANGKLSQPQMQQLLRVVADKDIENDKLLRNYTYIEREVQTKLDHKGQAKSAEERTYEILDIYGEQTQRLIEKDDKPLPEKETAKEEEKLQKIIDKRKNESAEDRKKREEKEEKEREEDREFVKDVADAYNFTLVGTETLNGRDAWVIDGEPRKDFVPHAKDAKYLSKFRGRVWIDKSDLQLSKMDVECLETISWGVFLARINKGTRFTLEQTRVNDEVWLPLHVTARVDVRLALLKNYDIDLEQNYRDYKKFRTSAKIVGIGEVKEQK